MSGSPRISEWSISLDLKTFDMLIQADVRGTDTPMRGSIAMVGGRIMLSTGYTAPRCNRVLALCATSAAQSAD